MKINWPKTFGQWLVMLAVVAVLTAGLVIFGFSLLAAHG